MRFRYSVKTSQNVIKNSFTEFNFTLLEIQLNVCDMNKRVFYNRYFLVRPTKLQ